MKTKIRTVIAILILAVCCVVGCASQKEGENVNNGQTQNVTELIEHVYSDTELNEIWEFKGSLSELNKKYPIECLRESETVKSAVYLSDHDIVFVYFDRDGNQSAHSAKYSLHHTSEEFRTIQTGDTLDDVREFDPEGSYLFLHTGVNLPRTSTHCTTDGYLVTIAYDEQNIVTSIDIQMI